MKLELFNEDCMDVMSRYPDGYFNLAIVDPPYGISINMNIGRRKTDSVKHEKKRWDSAPPDEGYFVELLRCSKKVIVWGANNFDFLPPSNGWIVWDKAITGKVDFSMAELAYSNAKNHIKIVRIRAQSGAETYKDKIHPTQKPVKLYEWLLTNYSEKGAKILDTHLGSGSHAIAAHYFGVGEFVGCELDEDYFKAAGERIANETKQGDMF